MPNPPKPSHLKAVQGTERADRKNPREPQPPKGMPPVPENLTAEELIEWGRNCERLQTMGVLSEVDGMALEQLCVVTCEVRRLTLKLRDADTIVVTTTQKEQVEKLNPLWAQLNVARKRQHDLWAAFGLDPSSRTRVHTVQAPGNGNAQATKPPVKQANDYFN